MLQRAPDVRALLHTLARGRATSGRVARDLPQLSCGNLQDHSVQESGGGEDGLGAAVRVQVLHASIPETLAAASRGEHMRGEVIYNFVNPWLKPLRKRVLYFFS